MLVKFKSLRETGMFVPVSFLLGHPVQPLRNCKHPISNIRKFLFVKQCHLRCLKMKKNEMQPWPIYKTLSFECYKCKNTPSQNRKLRICATPRCDKIIQTIIQIIAHQHHIILSSAVWCTPDTFSKRQGLNKLQMNIFQ